MNEGQVVREYYALRIDAGRVGLEVRANAPSGFVLSPKGGPKGIASKTDALCVGETVRECRAFVRALIAVLEGTIVVRTTQDHGNRLIIDATDDSVKATIEKETDTDDQDTE